MSLKQNNSSLRNWALPLKSAASKKFHICDNIINSKSVGRKSSVDDLAEEGYIFGRLLGQGSYSKVK